MKASTLGGWRTLPGDFAFPGGRSFAGFEGTVSANRTQERHATIAAERNEVKMPAPVDPNEFVGHDVVGTKSQTLPNPRRVCHPEKQTSLLGVDVSEWYH